MTFTQLAELIILPHRQPPARAEGDIMKRREFLKAAGLGLAT